MSTVWVASLPLPLLPSAHGTVFQSLWRRAPFLQVSEKLKLAEKTALDIDRLRDGYRPAARRGAILFFVLSEMALVNAMYQYSLNAFLEVFGFSLKKSLPDSILMKRLRNIMDTLTFNIYNYGCTGERLSPSTSQMCSGPGRPAVLGPNSLFLQGRGSDWTRALLTASF